MKPFAARILLPLKDENYSGEAFIGLGTTLYSNRLILHQPRELRKLKGDVCLTVIFCDQNAFETWTRHKKIQQYWAEKFKTYLKATPKTIEETDIIIETDNCVNCTCKTPAFYILDGRRMAFIGGLACGDCLGNVSMSRIPGNIRLESWLRNYQRVYSIWLDSGVLENWALQELSDYQNGELNREGHRLRKELEEHLGTPVYLTCFEEEPGEQQNCYSCGNEGIKNGLEKTSQILPVVQNRF